MSFIEKPVHVSGKAQKEWLEFTQYLMDHPDERFWQALRNWCDVEQILVVDQYLNEQDTYYWQNRNGTV